MGRMLYWGVLRCAVGTMLLAAGLASAQEEDASATTDTQTPQRLEIPIPIHSTRLEPLTSLLLDIAVHSQNEEIRQKAMRAVDAVNELAALEVAHQDALIEAISIGDTVRVGTLASEPFGVNFRTTGMHWSTPLHYAVGVGNVQVVAALLAHGADALALDYLGERPMYDAIKNEQIEVVRVLLDRGVPANDFTREITWGGGGLPLALACSAGNLELVDLLLSRGADVNADGGVDWPPLLAALGRPEHLEIAEKLLASGADPNRQRSIEGYTPLHAVAWNTDDPETMRRFLDLLLEHGASVDAADARGRTPLHQCACSTNLAAAGRLIEARAPLELTDRFGITAFGYAETLGNEAMAALLRERGAAGSPAFLPEEVLHRAILQADEATVQRLLAEGADANARSASGWMPLHVAAFCPRALPPAITNALLAHGADPNATGPNGWTPLHVLAICDDSRMTRDVLKAGADPKRSDADGNLPSTLASNAGNQRAEWVLDGRLPLR